MALHQAITTATLLLFVLVLARVELSTSHVLKGSVTCLDCGRHYDLSDIKVSVKCSKVKKLAVATTGEDGTFEAELPSDTATSPPSFDCLARILGGPTRLYASRKDMVSRTSKNQAESDSYTLSAPLKFYQSCPSSEKSERCGAGTAEIGSSKAVDQPDLPYLPDLPNLPLPPEWGLAPSSYYIPFFPIIGIP